MDDAFAMAKRLRTTVLVLLTAAVALSAGEGNAQGRGPSAQEIRNRAKQVDEPASRAAKIAELDEWLRRLQGRFHVRISTVQQPEVTICIRDRPNGKCMTQTKVQNPVPPTFEGSGECRAIGDGSGSSCRFEIIAKTPLINPYSSRSEALPDASTMPTVPVVILYGLDPDTPGIRLMWLGGAGRIWEASGPLERNTVKTKCNRLCFGMTYMLATDDGQRIDTSFMWSPAPSIAPTNTVLELRRLPEGGKEAPGADSAQDDEN